MAEVSAKLLDNLAHRAALETVTLESAPAFFETTKGERAVGYATVSVSRSSIAIHFTSDMPMAVGKAGYGEANGRIGAINGAWLAPQVNDVGPSATESHLFVARELAMNQSAGDPVATRLVFAGAAWQGTELVDGRPVVVAALAKEAVNHHEARLSIAAEGCLDEPMIEAIDRAGSFIAGIDLELLRVDTFSAQGDLIRVRHLRGFRRVGRGLHSPFTGIADEHRMRAWAALVAAIPRLENEGIPIITIISHIAAHNQVAEINSGAALLLLAVQTTAYQRMHGSEVDEGASSRRQEMQLLNRDLNLGLGDDDLARFEKLRVELLDAGFFHKPGYETGRPQKDIKFVRDVAHTTVLRLCGYSGPFYGAETFAVQRLPAGTVA
jgi:hypothetical protein